MREGRGGCQLKEEADLFFSPSDITPASLSPTQPISQSVHTPGSVTGQGEKAAGREDEMRRRRRKGGVSGGKNGTAACPGGSERRGTC